MTDKNHYSKRLFIFVVFEANLNDMNVHVTDNTFWMIREIGGTSEDLLSLLDKKELYLPYIQKIKTESRRIEWLSVRLLLKEMLGEEKEVLYTETGSPYLSDHSYYLSISHTKGYVAAALNKEIPVGIDVEYLSSRVRKIRTRFLNEEEERSISQVNEDVHLLLHWSAKESLFKALGETDVDFKTSLHIDAFEPDLGALSSFSAYETKTIKQHHFIIHYKVFPGFLLTFTHLKAK